MASILRNLIRNRGVLTLRSTRTALRAEHAKLDAPTHKVNNLERKFLVWTGKYKSVDQVPDFVQQNVMERARNRMRVRIANYMMAATALACLLMVYLGKKAAQRGDSVVKQNLEWHKQFNEQEAKK